MDKKERLWQLNHGDSYRNDINPSSLDLAIRVVSLWMNVEYSCHFYEGINNNNRFRLLVREDHQSSRCRGEVVIQQPLPLSLILILIK